MGMSPLIETARIQPSEPNQTKAVSAGEAQKSHGSTASADSAGCHGDGYGLPSKENTIIIEEFRTDSVHEVSSLLILQTVPGNSRFEVRRTVKIINVSFLCA